MSLAGVRSNRGDSYQTYVAFERALDILANDNYQWLEVDSTILDANRRPISVDDVVIGCTDGRMICCQCKKNQTDFEPWSISDLKDELKKAAQLMTADKNVWVVFYTRGSGFGALAKLREHSTNCPDADVYLSSLAKENQQHDKALTELIGSFNIGTFEFVRRVSFETTAELERMEEQLKERLAYLVSNPTTVFDALWTRLDKLGSRIVEGNDFSAPSTHRLNKSDLREIITKSGSMLVPPMAQQDIRRAFASLSAIGRSWRTDINGKCFALSASNELIEAVASKQHSVLLTGGPGSGKTCVLLKLQATLEQRQDLVALFIQAREFAGCATTEARTSQGLPENWVGLVARMADYQHTVVTIDSLDVLSLSRDPSVLSYFLAQMDRLSAIPNVTLIAACREFDRKYDNRLSVRKWDKLIMASVLNWEADVAPFIRECGIPAENLDATTRRLLQNPRELALFADIAARTRHGFNVATSQALARKYLETIVQGDSELGMEAMQDIENMANAMLASRRLALPHSVAGLSDGTIRRLLSVGVLHENESSELAFGHQTLLDVLVVSAAERNRLSLSAFIKSLPPVPFVRPTIRAYVAYLAAGDRASFRKQLRAVFASHVAFHIRRLVAESLTEQIPQDEDWPLMRDLFHQRRELFEPLYFHASLPEWHYFWLKFLVPYALQERDAQLLATHVRHIESWKHIDPQGVISFWLDTLQLDWLEQRDRVAETICFLLIYFELNAETNVVPLLDALMNFPRQKHDSLGRAIARAVDAGQCGDEVLWRYIAGDVHEEDIMRYNFDEKLRCLPQKFGDKGGFLERRMRDSEGLLKLAIDSIESWGSMKLNMYGREWYEGFLWKTSHDSKHSQRDISPVFSANVLFNALEAAITHHAKTHSAWWQRNRQRLAQSCEGALCYFAILAVMEAPEKNIAEAAHLALNQAILQSHLRYEIGRLLNVAFVYFDEETQDAILALIMALWREEETEEQPWMLESRVELLAAIPIHLRSLDAQAMIQKWENIHGTYVCQPDIFSRGGWVLPPFSFQLFLEFSDSSVLQLLAHYSDVQRDNWEHSRLIGGSEAVEGQLQEAASRAPLRFMRFLVKHWHEIPRRFIDDIVDGASTYLAYRHGNLRPSEPWEPSETPEPQSLAGLIMDELERHPAHWHHHRTTAKALHYCAQVVQTDEDAARLVFISIGFANLWERHYDNSSLGLIHAGINMIVGDVAEAIIILATRWAEAKRPFPELLVPTLLRYANHPSPAVRAVILRRLAYFQYHSPDLGWQVFHMALQEDHEQLWEVAEPCLYYAYHERFDIVSSILDRIYTSAVKKALETWGRIAALACFSEYIKLDELLDQLLLKNSNEAWHGASLVWAHKQNIVRHREQCFKGLMAGLKSINGAALSVARNMHSIFHDEEPIVVVPQDIIDAYLSTVETNKTEERMSVYGFDGWLNALSQNRPGETLAAAESFAGFMRRSHYPSYEITDMAKLLTRLFREAEEQEEVDEGVMLGRVIALQDALIAAGIDSLQNWLRDAERP